MIKPFKRLVIDKSKVENTALFRTKETGLSYITTDAENSFYSLIKENNLTGIDFHEIEAIQLYKKLKHVDKTQYGTHSMRRTKTSLIYKKLKSLSASTWPQKTRKNCQVLSNRS